VRGFGIQGLGRGYKVDNMSIFVGFRVQGLGRGYKVDNTSIIYVDCLSHTRSKSLLNLNP
jgi:hypothetical protein